MEYNDSINAYTFSRYAYYSEDDAKIIYIPLYDLYAYYEENKFIVYKLDEIFNKNNYSNTKEINISMSFADNLKYIYDIENDIIIISKNNKIYFDNI